MQQAVKLSEIENGDKKEWAINGDIEEYYNKYYSKYLNGARFEKTGNYMIQEPDAIKKQAIIQEEYIFLTVQH